ncbi:MAG TPA: radical SAM protein [bacterium]|nr:radical SAM protein [bacterium]
MVIMPENKAGRAAREQNLVKLREAAAHGREDLESYPAVLYLEATAVCNLRCPMCPTTIGLPREPYRTEMFDLELLPKIESVLPYVARAFLSGGGEPLLHPKFFDIVRRLKRHAIEVHFNSNATLLDEARAREMIASGVDTISFSIDGATAETYAKIRVPADFGRVTANIRRLAELKKLAGSERPFLNMQFTVSDLNATEITRAVPLAASLGINHLVVEPLTPVFCFDSEYFAFYHEHAVEAENVVEDVREAAREAARLGLVFSSHYLAAGPALTQTCAEPWLTFGVRVDGRVFTCCGMIEPMGDLGAQPFDEIWNGPLYRLLRRALFQGAFPEFCSLCIHENRANHFNEDLLTP